MLSNGIHDPRFPLKIKFKLDLGGKLIHSRHQVKPQLSLGQEGSSNADVCQVLQTETTRFESSV